MYVVIVEFSIRPEFTASFRDRVRQQARDSLERESDCHVFDVCIDPERDDLVLLYEVYSNRGAFATHLASVHFRDFDETADAWIIDKRLAFYERI